MSDKSKKGTITELKAAAHFMKQGFYVAKALDPHCPFDLVLTDKKGQSCLIDVKSKSIRKKRTHWCKAGSKINRSPNPLQKKMNVQIYIHDEEKPDGL